MNILHINQSDIHGGAALAAYRLHCELLKKGVGSKMLVGSKSSEDLLVDRLPRKYRQDQILGPWVENQGKNYAGLSGGNHLEAHPWFQEADVIHYHSFHTGYFNYLFLEKLITCKPSVFTLHDMWLFTGHCSYSYECERWRSGCGQCPHPEVFPAIKVDKTHWEWNKKKKIFEAGRVCITAPSQWLANLAKGSLLGQCTIEAIPNGIDVGLFPSVDKSFAKRSLGIPEEGFTILFGAFAADDPRKGGALVLDALRNLPAELKEKLTLLILGGEGRNWKALLNVNVVGLGFVQSEKLKPLIYSAADVFISPTRAEAFGLMIQESMAVGTPVIASAVGGVVDLIEDCVDGLLLRQDSGGELLSAILRLAQDSDLRRALGQAAKAKIERSFSIGKVADSFTALYHKSMNQ